MIDSHKMKVVDDVVYSARWTPRRGWHDDHRHLDRTDAYLPAMQQVRSEFMGLVGVIDERRLIDSPNGVIGGSCLQLGIGEIDCSHEVFDSIFNRVAVSMDFRVCRSGAASWPGMDLRSKEARYFASERAPYDMLFIDAGHLEGDAALDLEVYGAFVRRGGIIAFHDALPRPGYETEILVWKDLDALRAKGVTINMIGTEVGIAWMVKE